MTSLDTESLMMLGGLREAIDGLKTAHQQMATMWSNQERDAVEGRRRLHDKLDEVKGEVTQLKNDVSKRMDNVEKTLIDIGPEVAEFKVRRHEARGALKFGRWLWGIIVAAAATGGWGIHEWLAIKPPILPPHP